MMPDWKLPIVRVYVVVGIGVCVLFAISAVAGWKLPDFDSGHGGGRRSTGFWGMGK